MQAALNQKAPAFMVGAFKYNKSFFLNGYYFSGG